MKLGKYGIIYAALCMLICTSFTASALSFSDPTGDVSYGTASDYIGEVENRPNVDITQLSVTVNSNSVTLSLTVAGTIQISEDVGYLAYVNSTDTMYGMSYTNAQTIGWSMNRSSEVSEYANESVTVTGNTLSAVFNLRGNSSMVTVYGLIKERILTQSGTINELWIDNAKYSYTPNSTDTTNTTDGNNINDNTGTSPGKTPGFELLPVIAAVTITAILLRRRR